LRGENVYHLLTKPEKYSGFFSDLHHEVREEKQKKDKKKR